MDHRAIRRQAETEYAGRMKRAAGGKVDDDVRQDKKMIASGVHQHESALHKGQPKTALKLKDGGSAEGGASKKRLDRAPRKRADGGSTGDADPADQALSRAVSAKLATQLGQGRARGGKAGKGKAHVNVNVISGGGDKPMPIPVPVPGAGGPPHPMMPPPGVGAGPMPGGPPPMAMAPGAGMPPGMPPRPPMAGPPGMMPGGGGMPPIRARGGAARANGGAAEAAEAHGKETAVKMTAGADSGEGRVQKSKMKIEDAAAAGD